jgi:hypothetical protein
MPNVSDINQLKAGAKLTEGQGAFWRANSDNSVTLFKRIRGKDSAVSKNKHPFQHSEMYRHPWELLSILTFGWLHPRVE